MFRLTSRKNANVSQDNAEIECTIRSLINDAHIISEHKWAVSLARKKNTEHAFLILEGKKDDEYTILRSDMFLDMTGIPFEQPENKICSVINFLWEKSQQMNGIGFIRIKELDIKELEGLAGVCEYQSWGLSLAQAEKLLSRLLEELPKTYPYNYTGNKASSVSTSRSDTQNCVTWCQKILREELGFDAGESYAIIKKPSEVVKKAILENNTKNKDREKSVAQQLSM